MPTAATARRSRQEDTHEHDKRNGVVHLPHVPTPEMPTGATGRVLWWGGLTAVGVAGVVDWPVVVLVGVGSWVAEQYAKSARKGDRR